MKKNIICISGDIGSGKSSLANILVNELNYDLIGTGTIQRNIAASKGITTLEQNKLSENDRSVDDTIDNYIKKTGEAKDNLVIDSRLAWFFIPSAFKVYVSVNKIIGAERVFNATRVDEENASLDETINNNLQRENYERERFINLYKINYKDYNNYNLVIDSSFSSPEIIAKKIIEEYNNWQISQVEEKYWISPMLAYPTQSIRDSAGPDFDFVFNSMKHEGYIIKYPGIFYKYNGFIYIWDGHKRTISAIRNKINLIPVLLVNIDSGENILPGLNAEQTVKSLNLSMFYDWEDASGFRYKFYPF